jgi:GT2 family glycosyltransferase
MTAVNDAHPPALRPPSGEGTANGSGRAAREAGEEQASPAGTAALDCSVVVPTFHRDRELARLLSALAEQDLPAGRFEVIVVDDACSASTAGVIEAVRSRHPGFGVRLLAGNGRGPAAARNTGWKAARGPIVAFIDDDAYPASRTWLSAGLAALADPTLAGVGGHVVVPADEPPTDFQRNVKQLEHGVFLTCNAFYRRAALEKVGGFDERFRLPFREDSDLQFRLQEQAGPLVMSPAPLVVHPAPPGGFAVSLRLQRYSAQNALIYKKHPRRYRAELEPRPPLRYYAMLGCFAGGQAAFFARQRRLAALLLAGWLALEVRFFLHRAAGTSHRPRHLLDLALTSLLIPPLSVYWRLRGAIRYRVFFF